MAAAKSNPAGKRETYSKGRFLGVCYNKKSCLKSLHLFKEISAATGNIDFNITSLYKRIWAPVLLVFTLHKFRSLQKGIKTLHDCYLSTQKCFLLNDVNDIVALHFNNLTRNNAFLINFKILIIKAVAMDRPPMHTREEKMHHTRECNSSGTGKIQCGDT